MKKLQRLCVATVFTLVLTSATLAGEIHTPGIAQPTPTPPLVLDDGCGRDTHWRKLRHVRG